jgi:hypothetical protein
MSVTRSEAAGALCASPLRQLAILVVLTKTLEPAQVVRMMTTAVEEMDETGSGMGVIINPRGASGAGKTELVRRILAQYGWKRGAYCNGDGSIEPVYHGNGDRPFGYRLSHPFGGPSLAVLGHYEATSGGCDTVRAMDGGIQAIMHRASGFAAAGDDVVIEGLRLSSDVEHSIALARHHGLHILRLSTPLERCVRNLVLRRHARKQALPEIEKATATEHRSVEEACILLQPHATVEILAFDEAYARALELLSICALRGTS